MLKSTCEAFTPEIEMPLNKITDAEQLMIRLFINDLIFTPIPRLFLDIVLNIVLDTYRSLVVGSLPLMLEFVQRINSVVMHIIVDSD